MKELLHQVLVSPPFDRHAMAAAVVGSTALLMAAATLQLAAF
jgi:hypothetical protein